MKLKFDGNSLITWKITQARTQFGFVHSSQIEKPLKPSLKKKTNAQPLNLAVKWIFKLWMENITVFLKWKHKSMTWKIPSVLCIKGKIFCVHECIKWRENKEQSRAENRREEENAHPNNYVSKFYCDFVFNVFNKIIIFLGN